MSQIKLVHSGGNGVIISAPSSNPASDVTFRLPNADGSAGQFMKTDGSGNLAFAAISVGGSSNISFDSGYGIDFSATANTSEGSTSSELFDDFEKGSWTPKIRTTGSSSGNKTGTGLYTKVGNIVFCSFAIDNVDGTGLQSNSTIRISQLPFAANSTDCFSTSPMTYNVDGNTDNQLYFKTNADTSIVGFRTVWGGSWQTWSSNDFRQSQIYVRASITYFTDS